MILIFSDDDESILNKVINLLEEDGRIENPCILPIGMPKLLNFPNLTIDPKLRVVICRGIELRLTTKEFDLLYFLASHPKQVFTMKQLYEGITDEEYCDTFRSVESSLYRLRKKLEGGYIENVRGYGYRFEPDIKR